MTQSRSDVVELIGVPFRYGGRGPDEYDCYGLVKELLRRDGIEVPDQISSSNVAKAARAMQRDLVNWHKSALTAGKVLLFRIDGYGAHVGYYLGDDRFIHTWEDSGGVVIERLSTWEHRLIGAYEYAGSEGSAALRPGAA